MIGNAAYSRAAPLRNPTNDARDIADVLTSLGFEVILQVDVSRKSMEDTLRSFEQRLEKGGVGLFFYSGHAIQVNGSNYLIPVDADIRRESDIEFETLNMGRIVNGMGDSGCSVNIIILDSCRDNPFARGKSITQRQGLAKMDSPPGFLIAFSTSPGSAASDGNSSSRNGLYTKHLIAVLRDNPYQSITDLFIEVGARVVEESRADQIPWQSVALIKKFQFAYRPDSQKNNRVFQVPDEMLNAQEITVNSKKVKLENIDRNEKSSTIKHLSGDTTNPLRQGLNYVNYGLSDAKKSLLMWYESDKLEQFAHPYKNSHAILIAIDDYDRINDPLQRGKTGFKALNSMVTHAEILKNTLQKVGFPSENIQSFYDKNATFKNVEKAIQAFWKGGQLESADRLFFYFGGHGYADKDDVKNGYLVTYDFDSKKPDLTSISMEDITSTYARKIRAHHMMVAIDACHAGLSVYKAMDYKNDQEGLKRFQALSLIRADTKRPARNVLLAGTGDQKALWENGGIFTIALIDALNGAADMNKDNIIQFEEIASYVRNQVVIKTSQAGVQQEPTHYLLDRFGEGKVVFINLPN